MDYQILVVDGHNSFGSKTIMGSAANCKTDTGNALAAILYFGYIEFSLIETPIIPRFQADVKFHLGRIASKWVHLLNLKSAANVILKRLQHFYIWRFLIGLNRGWQTV